jgi:hypothetical protein
LQLVTAVFEPAVPPIIASAIMATATMDHSHCHVVYFDERARFDRWVKKDGTASTIANPPPSTSSYFDLNAGEPDDLQANILTIRAVFNQGESKEVFSCDYIQPWLKQTLIQVIFISVHMQLEWCFHIKDRRTAAYHWPRLHSNTWLCCYRPYRILQASWSKKHVKHVF